MTGIYLKQSEAAQSLGVTIGKFINKFKPNLKTKKIGKHTFYFINKNSMKAHVQKLYKDKWVELDEEAEMVEEILGDVSGMNGDYGEIKNGTGDELKEAQLENLRMRTRVLKEKLEARKSELFSQWNLAFFNQFSEAFSKLKNELIALHLTDEQITLLNDRIDSALVSMQDRLNTMFNDFKNESNDEEELLDD